MRSRPPPGVPARLVCFSGHTHGGQIVIPRLTEAVLRLADQPFVRGLYEVRGNLLYVNRRLGFGRGGLALRLGSPPEVALFTLSRAARRRSPPASRG